MTSSSESELTSAELYSKLFNSFKSKGVLQSVKTQLRNRIALELHAKASFKSEKSQNYGSSGSLFLHVSNSLIMDHLKQYPYTQSVFISESLTDPEKVYSVEDILQLLHINPDAKLYQKLLKMSKQSENVKGFLWSFLLNLAGSYGYSTMDSSVQTDDCQWQQLCSIDEKLLDVERAQLQKFNEHSKGTNMSLEAKVLSFQRKYEAQKRVELKTEMERFRSTELANMRLEEKEKYQSEIENARKEYEVYYQQKLKDLATREEDILGRSSKEKQLFDKEAFEERQKLLNEMQLLKEREMEMKKNHEIALRSVDMQEEKLQLKAEQLKFKEESMKDIEDRYEMRLNDEISRVKYDLQQQEKMGAESLQSQQLQLKEEKLNFQFQKDTFLRWKEQAERLKDENQQLNLALMTAKQANSSWNQKYEMLAEQYKKVEDYGQIKSENILIQRDAELLKKKIEELLLDKSKREKEHQKLIKELLTKISSSNVTEGGQAVNKEIEETRLREQQLREKYQTLQNKYELEVLKNEDLRKLYEDCLLSQRECLREIDELRTALMMAKRESEKFRNTRNVVTSNIGAQPHMPSNGFSQKQSSTRRKLLQENSPSEKSMDFHFEASDNVFKKLEEEAMQLEKSYKDFQSRQKQSKTQSQVHFSSYVQRKSKSTNDSQDPLQRSPGNRNSENLVSSSPRNNTMFHYQSSDRHSFDLSRMIPDRSVLSNERSNDVKLGPDYFSTGSVRTNDHHSSSGTSQPLSSTQAPGASSHALSFGLSGVTYTQDRIDKRPPPAQGRNAKSNTVVNNPDEEKISSQKINLVHLKRNEAQSVFTDTAATATVNVPSSTTLATTCFSLTQNPLRETTVISDSLTQHPLYDSRNYNTLTQYPLIESDLQTPALKARDLVTPKTKKLDTLTEQSIGADLSVTVVEEEAGANNPESGVVKRWQEGIKKVEESRQNRVNSVEQEFDLKEATITTFESPTKSESKVVNDVFYTPAALHRNNNLNNDGNNKDATPNEVANENSDDLSSEKHSVDQSKSTVQELSNKDNISKVDSLLSEGEVGQGEQANDVMAQYMKMILQKKEEEKENQKDDLASDAQVTDYNDIPISDTEERQISEKSSISEFEW